MLQQRKPDAWVMELLFGPGRDRRFTQDSPVLPDVWLAYAAEPSRPQEVLLTPDMDPDRPQGPTTTGKLRTELTAQLEAERQRPNAWARAGKRPAPSLFLAHNQSTVLARLWFDELVRVVLPRSIWWLHHMATGPLGKAENLVELSQSDRLARLLDDPELAPQKLGLPVGVRPTRDMLWMARLVGAIALVRQKPLLLPTLQKKGTNGLQTSDLASALIDVLFDMTVPRELPRALVWNVSLNRPATHAVTRSRNTVKADAATRVFNLSCASLSWAVIDSGIDATHPAFRLRDAEGRPFDSHFVVEQDAEGKQRVVNQTRVKHIYDFTFLHNLLASNRSANAELPEWLQERLRKTPALKRRLSALRREYESPDHAGEIDWQALIPFLEIPIDDDPAVLSPLHDHGTHVAGIMGADWREVDQSIPAPPRGGVQGLCPDLRLYDLRVLDAQGQGHEFNIIAALQFLRFLNHRQDIIAIQGANLSLSLEHDVKSYACGVTPICQECERLVADGMVVVAAAGNRGFQVFETGDGPLEGFLGISITDPGNAQGVITVGSTHRFEPHTYGVSYFSSRGPSADGRLKPDLVAPGEKIVSAVPGGHLSKDGTSMASPHVCGVIALLMARHRELIGQPARIKQILCKSATDLGRERFFQGHGMVDALRALQSL